MSLDYIEEYEKITKGFALPANKYVSPEDQGLAIPKCTLLKNVNIEYSNETILKNTPESKYY